MSATLANPAEMIRLGAPRLIRNDEELTIYTAALFDLTAKEEPSSDESEAIDLLSLLIERYEDRNYPVPKASPVEVLRFLMDHNGLAEKDLIQEFGSAHMASLVLDGDELLTREQIARLSARFHLSPEVFFGDAARDLERA